MTADKTITVGDRAIRIREMTPADIRALLKSYGTVTK